MALGQLELEPSRKIKANKQMNGEGMQLSSTLYFKGSMRYRLYFQKGTKQQSLINIKAWTLNLNWSDEKVKRQRIDTVGFFL